MNISKYISDSLEEKEREEFSRLKVIKTQKGAAARRVRRYYQLQRRCFFRYCETWLLPQARAEYHAALAASRPLPCFRAELGYRVTWNQDGLWSLYTHTRETCPGSPPLLGRRGDTWDLAAGYPVPLKAFFPGVRSWKGTLLASNSHFYDRRVFVSCFSFIHYCPADAVGAKVKA